MVVNDEVFMLKVAVPVSPSLASQLLHRAASKGKWPGGYV